MNEAAEAEFVRCQHPQLQQVFHFGGDIWHTLVDCEACHGPTRVQCGHLEILKEVARFALTCMQSDHDATFRFGKQLSAILEGTK